jgi:hypothetical protein
MTSQLDEPDASVDALAVGEAYRSARQHTYHESGAAS